MKKAVDLCCVLYDCVSSMKNDKVHFMLALFIVRNTCILLCGKNLQCIFRHISIVTAQDMK